MSRGTLKGNAQRGNYLSFGAFGLKAMSRGLVTARQIEAARMTMSRELKRGGKLWIRVFPDHPITATAAETPMGSGKGTVEYYAAKVRPGFILFEMDGVPEETAKEAMRLASHKLPIRTRFIRHL